VEVRSSNPRHLLVLDAGTGIRPLGRTVGPQTERVDVLLTHLHMDHIQGLGFFGPLYTPGLEVHLWGPPSTTQHLRDRLARYLSPPLFPVRIRDLPCKLTLHDAPLGDFDLNGLRIRAALVCHPGPTLGYRISEGGRTMSYLGDHEPALGVSRFPLEADWTSGFNLAAGADLLIHDAQYNEAEYLAHVGWGHSTLAQTFAFAEMTAVKRLVTFHHDPAHDDDTLERMTAEARETRGGSFDLVIGAEGASFVVGE